MALHRTHLRFLDHKNFSVLFFFKPDRLAAPVLAVKPKSKTEKVEKNFSGFHF
ncbi:hypothetical protein ASV31_02535 [Enterobacter hormaechei subsp. hoffmannii]|nr:hypothetical protein ASV31_02535 [Enterobacter hormaechei subsp. hoffmannii]KTJ71971.1 hypothetical protein ASU76_09925 [Enterobacter hormaechei subsp. hoffmannii]KTJ94567.1 hypothetical protein ASU71_15160 [Enterobacter hormaechei subsp. hoffmannii]KTK07644.1 hypothetical protein ASU67_15285 [Enterobacter hormaechei subsp. hoffmannii]KVI99016.1 hypothetical protein AWS42_14675 [Enterobacter hormaechei subsp. hoffmannii]